MAFSESTRRELKDEAERLEKELRQMQAQAEKIRSRLASINSLLESDPGGNGTGSKSLFEPDRKPIKDLPFRDAVRRILQESRVPLSPNEIRKKLEAHGVQPGGSTHPGQRISNELYKLKRKGDVKKSNGGYELIRRAFQ